jgi:hypothetical protein
MAADRPGADEVAALLEPVLRQRIPGAEAARIVNWRGTDRGFSTETFLFELEADDASGKPKTLRRLVFRRPPEVDIFPDYDLRRQVLVMNRLRTARSPFRRCAGWTAPTKTSARPTS